MAVEETPPVSLRAETPPPSPKNQPTFFDTSIKIIAVFAIIVATVVLVVSFAFELYLPILLAGGVYIIAFPSVYRPAIWTGTLFPFPISFRTFSHFGSWPVQRITRVPPRSYVHMPYGVGPTVYSSSSLNGVLPGGGPDYTHRPYAGLGPTTY
jgi:hypothetical protein